MPKSKVLKVLDVMSKDVLTLSSKMTIKEAAQALVKNKFSGAPVLDEKGKLIGVISEKDLFRALYPSYRDLYIEESLQTLADPEKMQEIIRDKGKNLIKDIISKKLVTSQPDDHLVKVGAIMMAQKIHRLPVVNKRGKLVGIISRENLYRTIFKQIFGTK